MAQSVPKESFRSLASRRLLILPAALLAVLVAMPWLLEVLENLWGPLDLRHLRELIESAITLLLGAWVMTLIHREQKTSRQHVQELERLSLTDPLTGLGNRRALERELERRISRSRRLGEPVALLYLDVDEMKAVNDRYGHGTGDETLKALASVLRSSSRYGSDQGFRVGGDEFVMVTAADRGGAEAIAGRIALTFPERSPHASKASMGVVVWDGTSSVADLLEEADNRMYRHKRPAPIYHWS